MVSCMPSLARGVAVLAVAALVGFSGVVPLNWRFILLPRFSTLVSLSLYLAQDLAKLLLWHEFREFRVKIVINFNII